MFKRSGGLIVIGDLTGLIQEVGEFIVIGYLNGQFKRSGGL